MPTKVLTETVYDQFAAQAERTPDAVAIAAPDRAPLTYAQLLSQIQNVKETLNACGIGRNDRVIIVLVPDQSAGAGTFEIHCRQRASLQTGFAQSDDIALILHTSGTTSAPKIVPLTHRNICAMARNNQVGLELTETDLCLNIMPLFHSTGLVGVVLASLVSGAGVVCTPGFYAPQFFDWLD